MRVAVRHTDEDHPNADWFAVEQGRILGFVHPITGESFTPEQVADALLARAKEQFPEAAGYEHRIETMHTVGQDQDGNDQGEWYPIGESDLPRVGTGGVVKHELVTDQSQKGISES